MDRLTSMAVFARVLELRSFSGAARDLGISQATVSKHVQTLEEWLGRQLLTRTTRRVQPTQEGEGFYVRCQRILEEIEDVRIETVGDALRGRIQLGCANGLAAAFIGGALGRLIAAHGELSVAVVLTDAESDPAAGDVDAAITLAETVPPPGQITQLLAELPVVLCASPGYLANRGQPRTPADLGTHDCLIGTEPDHAVWCFQPDRGDDADRIQVHGRLISRSVVILRDAAMAGAGILLAPPKLVADDLMAGRLVPVLPDAPLMPVALHAVYASDRYLSTRLRGVLTALSIALTSAG